MANAIQGFFTSVSGCQAGTRFFTAVSACQAGTRTLGKDELNDLKSHAIIELNNQIKRPWSRLSESEIEARLRRIDDAYATALLSIEERPLTVQRSPDDDVKMDDDDGSGRSVGGANLDENEIDQLARGVSSRRSSIAPAEREVSDLEDEVEPSDVLMDVVPDPLAQLASISDELTDRSFSFFRIDGEPTRAQNGKIKYTIELGFGKPVDNKIGKFDVYLDNADAFEVEMWAEAVGQTEKLNGRSLKEMSKAEFDQWYADLKTGNRTIAVAKSPVADKDGNYALWFYGIDGHGVCVRSVTPNGNPKYAILDTKLAAAMRKSADDYMNIYYPQAVESRKNKELMRLADEKRQLEEAAAQKKLEEAAPSSDKTKAELEMEMSKVAEEVNELELALRASNKKLGLDEFNISFEPDTDDSKGRNDTLRALNLKRYEYTDLLAQLCVQTAIEEETRKASLKAGQDVVLDLKTRTQIAIDTLKDYIGVEQRFVDLNSKNEDYILDFSNLQKEQYELLLLQKEVSLVEDKQNSPAYQSAINKLNEFNDIRLINAMARLGNSFNPGELEELGLKNTADALQDPELEALQARLKDL